MVRQEKEIGPDLKTKVAIAANKLVSAKEDQPGGKWHQQAMGELVDLLANNPEAISTLEELQNDHKI